MRTSRNGVRMVMPIMSPTQYLNIAGPNWALSIMPAAMMSAT
ncbi:MAG: hypothetical protein WAL40_03640 [Rhodoplanes sp.]